MEAVVARGVQLLIALSGAYLVALWFVLAVWTFRDIERRSKSVVTQVFSTLLVVLFYVPGVLLYMILRPRDTLDEAFQRSLEEEYLLQDLEELPLCISCQRYVEDDYLLCPHCHAQLREPCPACERLVHLSWSLCPYCGAAQGERAAEKQEKVEAPAARWTAPTLRRRRAAAEETAAAASISDDAAGRTALSAEPVDERTAALIVVPGSDGVSSVRPFERPRSRTRANGAGHDERTDDKFADNAETHDDAAQAALVAHAEGRMPLALSGLSRNGRGRLSANGTNGRSANGTQPAHDEHGRESVEHEVVDEPVKVAAEVEGV